MRETSEDSRRNWLTRWAWCVFRYDGLLPATVYIVPGLLVAVAGPGIWIELTAVILPIAAFLFRARIGLQQIDGNACRLFVRHLQKIALCVGLVALLLVDAFVVLCWAMPRNALGRGDYLTTLLIYAAYLALMAFAGFPGRKSSVST